MTRSGSIRPERQLANSCRHYNNENEKKECVLRYPEDWQVHDFKTESDSGVRRPQLFKLKQAS